MSDSLEHIVVCSDLGSGQTELNCFDWGLQKKSNNKFRNKNRLEDPSSENWDGLFYDYESTRLIIFRADLDWFAMFIFF